MSEIVRFTFIHFPLPTLSASGARLRSQTVPKDFELSENDCAQASSAHGQIVKINMIEQIEQKEFEGKPNRVRGRSGRSADLRWLWSLWSRPQVATQATAARSA